MPGLQGGPDLPGPLAVEADAAAGVGELDEVDRLELRAGEDRLRLSAKPQAAVKEWQALQGQGIKVRTRALTTTLYARLSWPTCSFTASAAANMTS